MRKLVYLIIISLFLFSCSLESKFSLENNIKNDEKLIGKWQDIKNVKEFLIVEKFDENYLQLQLDDKTKLKFFTSQINDKQYISIINEEGRNTFYQIEFKDNNTISYYSLKELEDNQKDFTSQNELISFIKNQSKEKDFYSERGTLIRVTY